MARHGDIPLFPDAGVVVGHCEVCEKPITKGMAAEPGASSRVCSHAHARAARDLHPHTLTNPPKEAPR